MNTHSKKDIIKQIGIVNEQMAKLQAELETLQKQLARKELILPFCVKRNDREILMQGGDELPSTLYANLHNALTKAGKRITSLNVTRFWSLYNIVKVYCVDKKEGYFSLTTSIGKRWFIEVQWEGSGQRVILQQEGKHSKIHVPLKYRFTLADLLVCLDKMNGV